MVSLGIILNIDNVSDFLKNSFLKKILIDTVINEIILSINYDTRELKNYFNKTLERFENPYIDHKLKAISLNSLSKFKSRIIPSIVSFSKKYNIVPYNLYFILSSFIILYHRRKHFKIIDNSSDQFLFDDINLGDDNVNQILSNKNFWGVDLLKLPKLKEYTSVGIKLISDEYNIKKAYSDYIEKIKIL
jgi:tagaturonate reductase